MFESFFEMKATAFSRDIPTAQLYESNQLEEIIGRLNNAAERQLFAVMIGECGLGKATAVRLFNDQLDPSRFKLLYLSDSKLTPRHFYKGMLEQLGLESKFYRADAKRQLHREIELMKGIHKLTRVCVVDEAHLLDREMLDRGAIPPELPNGCAEPDGAHHDRTDRIIRLPSASVIRGKSPADRHPISATSS